MAEENMKKYYDEKLTIFSIIYYIDIIPLFYLILFYDEKKSAKRERRKEARKNKEYVKNI